MAKKICKKKFALELLFSDRSLHGDKHTDSPPPPYTPVELSRISSMRNQHQSQTGGHMGRNSSPACSSIDYATMHPNNSISK